MFILHINRCVAIIIIVLVSASIKDEEHFLLHCNHYSDERVRLFTKLLLLNQTLFDDNNVNVVYSKMMQLQHEESI